jgi:hypothetical protein
VCVAREWCRQGLTLQCANSLIGATATNEGWLQNASIRRHHRGRQPSEKAHFQHARAGPRLAQSAGRVSLSGIEGLLKRLIHWTTLVHAPVGADNRCRDAGFLSATRKLLDDAERSLLVEYLAYSPSAGDLIPGTGGLRKLRWGLEGRGKRGGARVIYFFYNAALPLFVLTVYAKNERADISQAERNEFQKLTRLLVQNYARHKR